MHAIKILVAEDDPVSCILLCDFLAAEGHDVSAAHDGKEALHRARSGHFDLMVVDLHMPFLDGLQVIRALRGEPGHEALVLIAVTGDGGARKRDELRAAGADCFMVKPLDLVELLAQIEPLRSAHAIQARRGL
jgi:DNA-binding response OmpR family regulator